MQLKVALHNATVVLLCEGQVYSISKERMERVRGIEPLYTAWKAGALPLCYTRSLGFAMNAGGANATVRG